MGPINENWHSVNIDRETLQSEYMFRTMPDPDGDFVPEDYMSDEQVDAMRADQEEFDAADLAQDIRNDWAV